MKVTEVMFSGVAAKQYAYFFSKENNVDLKISTETKEGICFVTVHHEGVRVDLLLSFMYKMGELQEALRNDRELMLPVDKYPLPPKED